MHAYEEIYTRKYESVTSRKDRDYPAELARTDTLISNQTQLALNRLDHTLARSPCSLEVTLLFDVNSVC
jgi:hypothetical protein